MQWFGVRASPATDSNVQLFAQHFSMDQVIYAQTAAPVMQPGTPRAVPGVYATESQLYGEWRHYIMMCGSLIPHTRLFTGDVC